MPQRLDDRIAVALIAYEEHRTGLPVPMACREMQLWLRRSNSQRPSRALRRVTGRWLAKDPRGEDWQADEYGLATSLSPDERYAWVRLGVVLFGPEGLVRRGCTQALHEARSHHEQRLPGAGTSRGSRPDVGGGGGQAALPTHLRQIQAPLPPQHHKSGSVIERPSTARVAAQDGHRERAGLPG
jgi:hypothetical protein